MLRPYCSSLGRKGMGGGGAVLPSLGIDFTTAVSPTRAIPYDTGERYKFTRASTVWCQAYDTATQALKWVEIPADVPPMPGMRWDAVNSLWSPYDDNGLLIPASIRKGYWYLPQATNSVAYSRNFSGTGWATHSAAAPTLTQDAAGFDGTLNAAWTLTTNNASSTDGQSWGYSSGPQPVGTHLGAVKVKKEASSRIVTLRIRSADNSAASWLYLDVQTGAASVSAGTTVYGVDEDGDWWTPWVCVTTTNATSAVHLTLYGINAADPSPQSNATVFDQAEIRLNTTFYDGSPIVTNGSALTRLRGDYRLSINNHSNTAGMALIEMEPGLATSQIPSGVDNLINVSTTASVLYSGAGSIRSYDGTSELIGIITFTPGVSNKLAVRWSGSNRALVADGVETAGTYDGAFNLSGSDILLGYNNPVPFYLKSLKYYTADRGTAWIQGQQS